MLITCNVFALTVKDTTVFSRPAYLISWTDNAKKTRQLALIKTATPAYVGTAQYISYYDGNTLVKITSPFPNGPAYEAGFGSSVHHDNSTHHGGGTLTLVYQGAHHAIFNWNHTIDGAIETITYTFMDGNDYFQWQNTTDARNGTVAGDSRGPYCTMNWDGVDFSAATGVEYGAQKYFSQPSYNGPWTFTGNCDIPYNLEWDNNREIGYVQSQTSAQQLAGVPTWSGSLNMPASGSSVADNDVWMYDFQMNFYDKAKKITWGMPYGYMNGNSAAGCKNKWGQYSLSIVFDAMATAGVKRVMYENRAIHDGSVAVSTTNGEMVTTGPIGTVNPAVTTLSPVGYDHNYRTWWVKAKNASNLTINMNVSGATKLVNPTFRVKNMVAVPSSITYNGTTLNASTDYYASYYSNVKEAWITLVKQVSGSNTISLNYTGVDLSGDTSTTGNTGNSDTAIASINYTTDANKWTAMTDNMGSAYTNFVKTGPVAITFTQVAQPTPSQWPWVTLSCNMGEPLTGTTFVKITYKSSTALNMLLPQAPLDATGESYAVTLPASTGYNTVLVSMDDFAQPTWASNKVPLNLDIVTGIAFNPSFSTSGGTATIDISNLTTYKAGVITNHVTKIANENNTRILRLTANQLLCKVAKEGAYLCQIYSIDGRLVYSDHVALQEGMNELNWHGKQTGMAVFNVILLNEEGVTTALKMLE